MALTAVAKKLADAAFGGAGPLMQPVTPVPKAPVAPKPLASSSMQPKNTGVVPPSQPKMTATATPKAPTMAAATNTQQQATPTPTPTPVPAKATTGGNAPVQTKPLQANSSQTNRVVSNPINLMDWETRLAQGDENAANRTVTADQRVADQLNALTRSDSKYIENARLSAKEQSAENGMLMSSVAQGASQRAAIDAGLPIAQQDASTYANTASENMAATNADRLADQQMHGNLVGQEVGIRANLDESERGREFNAQQQTAQNGFTTAERLASQGWQGDQNALNRELETAKQTADQVWQSAEQALSRNASMSQLDKQLLNERFKTFDAALQNYNANLSQTLASIYSNTNLKPEQQAAAAANARALHESLMRSYAATMSAGLPEIYFDPYPAGG